MTEPQREELVEEIAQGLVEHYHPNFLFVKPTKWDREVAQSLITCIGKAYARGELELPGEMGRIGPVTLWHREVVSEDDDFIFRNTILVGPEEIGEGAIKGHISGLFGIDGARMVFIALSGTGK